MAPKIISFKGVETATRFRAASLRLQIEAAIQDDEGIIFDFSDVKRISDSFADECFGRLLKKFRLDKIRQKSRFKNASPAIMDHIANAYQERLSTY